jgi:hypothetical protein
MILLRRDQRKDSGLGRERETLGIYKSRNIIGQAILNADKGDRFIK